MKAETKEDSIRRQFKNLFFDLDLTDEQAKSINELQKDVELVLKQIDHEKTTN